MGFPGRTVDVTRSMGDAAIDIVGDAIFEHPFNGLSGKGSLSETQRGLVISEIAQFRERAAKREREKIAEVTSAIPTIAPSGPRQREWGKGQGTAYSPPRQQGFGNGAQGYNKPVSFVKEGSRDGRTPESQVRKTDEELEEERKEARRREEENSFRDVRFKYSLYMT